MKQINFAQMVIVLVGLITVNDGYVYGMDSALEKKWNNVTDFFNSFLDNDRAILANLKYTIEDLNAVTEAFKQNPNTDLGKKFAFFIPAIAKEKHEKIFSIKEEGDFAVLKKEKTSLAETYFNIKLNTSLRDEPAFKIPEIMRKHLLGPSLLQLQIHENNPANWKDKFKNTQVNNILTSMDVIYQTINDRALNQEAITTAKLPEHVLACLNCIKNIFSGEDDSTAIGRTIKISFQDKHEILSQLIQKIDDSEAIKTAYNDIIKLPFLENLNLPKLATSQKPTISPAPPTHQPSPAITTSSDRLEQIKSFLRMDAIDPKQIASFLENLESVRNSCRNVPVSTLSTDFISLTPSIKEAYEKIFSEKGIATEGEKRKLAKEYFDLKFSELSNTQNLEVPILVKEFLSGPYLLLLQIHENSPESNPDGWKNFDTYQKTNRSLESMIAINKTIIEHQLYKEFVATTALSKNMIIYLNFIKEFFAQEQQVVTQHLQRLRLNFTNAIDAIHKLAQITTKENGPKSASIKKLYEEIQNIQHPTLPKLPPLSPTPPASHTVTPVEILSEDEKQYIRNKIASGNLSERLFFDELIKLNDFLMTNAQSFGNFVGAINLLTHHWNAVSSNTRVHQIVEKILQSQQFTDTQAIAPEKYNRVQKEELDGMVKGLWDRIKPKNPVLNSSSTVTPQSNAVRLQQPTTPPVLTHYKPLTPTQQSPTPNNNRDDRTFSQLLTPAPLPPQTPAPTTITPIAPAAALPASQQAPTSTSHSRPTPHSPIQESHFPNQTPSSQPLPQGSPAAVPKAQQPTSQPIPSFTPQPQNTSSSPSQPSMKKNRIDLLAEQPSDVLHQKQAIQYILKINQFLKNNDSVKDFTNNVIKLSEENLGDDKVTPYIATLLGMELFKNKCSQIATSTFHDGINDFINAYNKINQTIGSGAQKLALKEKNQQTKINQPPTQPPTKLTAAQKPTPPNSKTSFSFTKPLAIGAAGLGILAILAIILRQWPDLLPQIPFYSTMPNK